MRILLLLCLIIGSASFATDKYKSECEALAKSKLSDAKKLHKLFDLDLKSSLEESPEGATSIGYPGYNDKWTDESRSAIERRKAQWKYQIKVLDSIKRARLSPADQLNYDIFRWNVESDRDSEPFPEELFPIGPMHGVHQSIPQTLTTNPTDTVKDYEDIISRLKGIPTVIHQTIDLMKEGIKRGILYPKALITRIPEQILHTIESPLEKNDLLLPFQKFPDTISPADRASLLKRAQTVVSNEALPAFRELYDFVKNTYLPASRDTTAWGDLPNGAAWYRLKIKNHTTLVYTAEELHKLGMSEVARIHAEMEQVKAEAGFKGTLAEFNKFMREDSKFYFDSADALIATYRDIAKRIDPELMKQFGKLPRMPYGVKPIPAYAEKSAPTAYYESGTVKAKRPGYFFANTYNLKARPKWVMEALVAHEAVPGHHLQIALAEELNDVPEFRKHQGFDSFAEGWGLYAESLGGELGLYKDPYSKYGALGLELWRSIRLVVDTGLHALGWSRQKAIDYFLENSGMAKHDVEVEVDRYLAWPGQALSYKVGQLTIKSLRDKARKALGAKFDIRGFHDAVLENGTIPLPTLKANIDRWITLQSK
jgi:uncharacterized protein (DUF885 family)